MPLLATLLVVILTSCASVDGSTDDVAILQLEVPLRAPVWSPGEEAVFALGQDGRRLARVDVNSGGFNPVNEHPRAVASTEELDGVAGENLALEKDREPDKVYVPVPDKGEVLVLEKDDLLEVRTFEAGIPPARVALEPRGAGTAPRRGERDV